MKTSLHTLNSSSREQRALFDRMIRLASPGDSLLLLENGCYCLTDQNALQSIHALGLSLYALDCDAETRGLKTCPALPATLSCQYIDDAGFVQLCCRHDKVVSWFC